jgi:hypothetical protein
MSVLAFVLAHQTQLVSGAAIFVALGRAIEAKFGARIAARFPKLAALAAMGAALAPDVVAAARALLALRSQPSAPAQPELKVIK